MRLREGSLERRSRLKRGFFLALKEGTVFLPCARYGEDVTGSDPLPLSEPLLVSEEELRLDDSRSCPVGVIGSRASLLVGVGLLADKLMTEEILLVTE